MALNLELDVSIVRNGTRMMVVDETGASLKTGDGKWNDDVAHSDVTGATLDITYPDATTEQKDFVALGYFGTAITGNFRYELFKEPNGLEKFPEGKYTFTYTITTATSTYDFDLVKYFYHKKQACVEQMWAALPARMCDNCNYQDYLDSCILAEALLRALYAAASFEDDTTVANLAADLDRICTVNNCNCE